MWHILFNVTEINTVTPVTHIHWTKPSQFNTFELIRLLIVACGMFVHSIPLNIGRNWNTLSYTSIQSIMFMLNGWHVQWVCWPCKNWDVFSFQELCTDPCNMGPCIIMLQHEVMDVDEWHNNGPQDLVTLSLCIQNAINKLHLCSLSITYGCPYHNPTATMGHSIHNVEISKPLTHTTPYTLSAICPVQWKPGFIRVKKTPLQSARRHRMWAFAHSNRLRWWTAVRSRPDEDDEHADELPWDGF